MRSSPLAKSYRTVRGFSKLGVAERVGIRAPAWRVPGKVLRTRSH